MIFIRKYLFFYTLSILILLCGCNNLLLEEKKIPKKLNENVFYKGKFSVNYLRENKKFNFQGSFDWDQKKNHTKIKINSLLGQTIFRVDVFPNNLIFKSVKGKQFKFETNEEIPLEILGWPFPVKILKNTLQGFIIDEKGKAIPVNAKEKKKFFVKWMECKVYQLENKFLW